MGSREEDDGKGGSPTLRQAEHVPKRERGGGGGALLWPKRTGLAVCGLEVPSFHGSVWFLVGNGGMDYAIGTTIRIHSPIPY